MRSIRHVVRVVSATGRGPEAAARERRLALLRACHQAARQLGWDEETRRDAQAAWAGKQSLAEFTDDELIGWAWRLKRLGANIWVPEPAERDRRWEMITTAQMAEIERLAHAMGWGGPDTPEMRRFCQRTTGFSHPRLLTRAKATDVITGLRRWLRQREARNET